MRPSHVDLAEAQAEIQKLQAEIAALREAVNSRCTCGGSGPDDPECCPACAVWHDMKAALREEVRWLDLHRGELPSGMDPDAYPAYVRALEDGR